MMMNFGGGSMPQGPMSCMCPSCMSGSGMPMGQFPFMPVQFPFAPVSEEQRVEMKKNALTWQKSRIASMRKQTGEFLKYLDESDELVEKQLKENSQSQPNQKTGAAKNT
jgi:hypothetical protein